jgi:hypothetical protein
MIRSFSASVRLDPLSGVDLDRAFVSLMQRLTEDNAIALVALISTELREQVEAYVRYCPRTEEGWRDQSGIGSEVDPAQHRRAVEILREALAPLPRPAFPPTVLAWNDACGVALARGIHEERAFDRLPILGDALEEAGCTDADLLEHLRGPGPHLPCCWGLAAILDTPGARERS